MSYFIEVEANDVREEKYTFQMINLDLVTEIIPLRTGGCQFRFGEKHPGSQGYILNVKDTYDKLKNYLIIKLDFPEPKQEPKLPPINKKLNPPTGNTSNE